MGRDPAEGRPAPASPSLGAVVSARGLAGGSESQDEGPQAPTSLAPAPPTWGALLDPLRPLLRAKQVEAAVEALVACLDAHGDCPSLVLSGRSGDPETKDLYTVRDSLGRVSLRDHTARVADRALALTRRLYSPGVAESRLPQALIMALGHDLGKIPAFRSAGAYAKTDHPAISVVKVQELWTGPRPYWLDAALTAIRDHHRASQDPLTQVLQRADQQAREEELARTAGALTVRTWPEWFDPEAWRAAVAQEVDRLQRGNQWLALSWHGVVYCRIDLLVQAARQVLRARQAVDLTFIAESRREEAARRLIDWLSAQGWLAQPIGSGYYGLPYEIQLRKPGGLVTAPVRVYLVPIRQDWFGEVAREFAARKVGLLALVDAVRAVPIRRDAP